MNVLVDTSVWSLALRRKPTHLNPAEKRIVAEWRQLVREGRVRLIGIICQELLSGISQRAAFESLRDHLSSFDDIAVETCDHVRAAEHFNSCRAKGIAATAVDMLLCSMAERHDLAVFTTDADFDHYATMLPFRRHEARTSAGLDRLA